MNTHLEGTISSAEAIKKDEEKKKNGVMFYYDWSTLIVPESS